MPDEIQTFLAEGADLVVTSEFISWPQAERVVDGAHMRAFYSNISHCSIVIPIFVFVRTYENEQTEADLGVLPPSPPQRGKRRGGPRGDQKEGSRHISGPGLKRTDATHGNRAQREKQAGRFSHRKCKTKLYIIILFE
jgi:hypothetical protein